MRVVHLTMVRLLKDHFLPSGITITPELTL